MSKKMDREIITKAIKKTREEWNTFTPKQKAKKIRDHINNMLEDESLDKQTLNSLQNELIIIEELDSKEIESHLDLINDIILENAINLIST